MGMMINRRRVFGGKRGLLPSGYTQVEYIESTGTQYIDTGLKAQYGDEFGLIYQQVTLDNDYRSLFGAAANGGDCMFYISQTSQASYVANVPISDIPRDKNRHTLSWIPTSSSIQYVVIDGITYTVNIAIINSNLNVMVFARNANQGKMIGKVYGYYQKRNGEYLINLIPCINPNNVVGMYDTVEGNFYSSPNRVAFVAGPVV